MIIELNEAHIGDTVYVTGAYIGGYKKADTFEEINAVFQFVSIDAPEPHWEAFPARWSVELLPVSGDEPQMLELGPRNWDLKVELVN